MGYCYISEISYLNCYYTIQKVIFLHLYLYYKYLIAGYKLSLQKTHYCLFFRLKHWAQREAFLELERREREGLPLIDPNLIQAELVELPSEEEIGDLEIVI